MLCVCVVVCRWICGARNKVENQCYGIPLSICSEEFHSTDIHPGGVIRFKKIKQISFKITTFFVFGAFLFFSAFLFGLDFVFTFILFTIVSLGFCVWGLFLILLTILSYAERLFFRYTKTKFWCRSDHGRRVVSVQPSCYNAALHGRGSGFVTLFTVYFARATFRLYTICIQHIFY